MNESVTSHTLDSMENSYHIHIAVRGSLLTLYAFTVVVGVGGNAIVCFTVLNMQRLRTVTNFFIVSLACCDIVMTALCVPFTVISNLIFYYWPFGPIMCPLVQYMNVVSVLQRTFTMLVMTLDRHHAIWRPLRRRIKKSEAKIIILVVLVISALLSLPVAMFSKIVYLEYEPGSNGLCYEEWSVSKARYWYSLAITLLQYFIPVMVMTVTYMHIGIIIWIKRPPGEADSGRDMRLAASKRKVSI